MMSEQINELNVNIRNMNTDKEFLFLKFIIY